MKLFFDMKWHSTHMNEAVWPHTVAQAAPDMPQSNTNINVGASTRLTATDSRADTMAFLGYPVARIRLLSPINT